jgi:hypothetical protein
MVVEPFHAIRLHAHAPSALQLEASPRSANGGVPDNRAGVPIMEKIQQMATSVGSRKSGWERG